MAGLAQQWVSLPDRCATLGRAIPETKPLVRPMVALLLVSFQILLLLLKAYFTKNDDNQIELKRIEEEQSQLNAAAEKAEQENRYSVTDPAMMDQFQDSIDKDRFDATTQPEREGPTAH